MSVRREPAGEATVADEAGTTQQRRFRITAPWIIGGAVVILLLISRFAITDLFFSASSLSTLTPLVGIMIIVATGQAFVISTGGIDLSVPAIITLMGTIVAKSPGGAGSKLVGALALCLGACVVIGLINGLLVEGLGLNALVVTLAVGQLVSGVTRQYAGNVPSIINVPSNLSNAASANVGGVSYLLLVSIAVALLSTFFVHRVVPGRRLVAASAAPRAAFLAGVPARRYRILAYVIGAVAYGIGGVLAAGLVGTPDLTLGNPYLLTSVVAVVLGGAVLTGGRVSPVATLLGAVFVTVLTSDLQVKGLSAGVQLLVQGIVLVVALSVVFVIRHLSGIRRAAQRFRSASPRTPHANLN